MAKLELPPVGTLVRWVGSVRGAIAFHDEPAQVAMPNDLYTTALVHSHDSENYAALLHLASRRLSHFWSPESFFPGCGDFDPYWEIVEADDG